MGMPALGAAQELARPDTSGQGENFMVSDTRSARYAGTPGGPQKHFGSFGCIGNTMANRFGYQCLVEGGPGIRT